MKQLLLVGFGGFIGSIARFWVSKLNISHNFLSIPIGTLTVNILGSLVIGLIAGLAHKHLQINSNWQLFLMVGVCGGFTTFSSFSNENFLLLQNGQILSSFIYSSLSILFGFLAVYLGYFISNFL